MSESRKYAAETRLLTDLERLDRLHAPPAIERLESTLGNERLSQVLLLLALWPEEQELFDDPAVSRAA
jgi:hypothetical protein